MKYGAKSSGSTRAETVEISDSRIRKILLDEEYPGDSRVNWINACVCAGAPAVSFAVQCKDDHSNKQQACDIEQQTPEIRVCAQLVIVPHPDAAHLFISEAVTVGAYRILLGITQTASTAFLRKFYSDEIHSWHLDEKR